MDRKGYAKISLSLFALAAVFLIAYAAIGISDAGNNWEINVTIAYPGSGILNSPTVGFIFVPVFNATMSPSNCTLYGNFSGAFEANSTNQTAITNMAANTITVNVGPDGAYNYTVYCYDTDGFFDYDSNATVTIDTVAPQVANNVSSTPATYSPSTASFFNVTWTDSNGINTTEVRIQGNWSGYDVNYTPNLFGSVYSYNDTLPAGGFYWRYWAKDNAGNWNATGAFEFTIAKADITVSLFLNSSVANTTYTYPQALNVTALASSGTIKLYMNGSSISTPYLTTLGNGIYIFSANATGDTNYSDNTTGMFLLAYVNKGTPDAKTFIDGLGANKTVSYPTFVTISGNSTTTINPPTFALYAGEVLGAGNPASQSVSMAPGNYNVIYNTSETANWSATSNSTIFLIVSQNSSNPVLLSLYNGTLYDNQNITASYGTAISVNCSNVYPSSGSCAIYRNETAVVNVTSDTETLGVGTYLYKVNTSGNTNYSANATGAMFYVTISKGNPYSYMNAYIDANNSNKTVLYPSIANITGNTSMTGSSDCVYMLWRDSENIINGSSAWNYTKLGNGTYAVKYNVTNCTNWTSNTTSPIYLTISPGVPSLTLLIDNAETDKSITYGAQTNVTGYESNTEDSDCVYTLYRSDAGNLSSPNNVQTLAAGTYTYVYNMTACSNWTSGTTMSRTLTVSAASSSSSSGGSVSTTSSYATPVIKIAKDSANVTLTTLTTSGKMIATIARYEGIAIRGVNLTVVNNVANIRLAIRKLVTLPQSVSFGINGMVYNYISIDKTNITDADVGTVSLRFAVNKTWLSDNGIADTNITLYRWNGNAWADLNAAKVGNDSAEVFYQVSSPGLSVFTIGTRGGSPVVVTPSGCTESWSCGSWSECADEMQIRSCTDANSCGTSIAKPAETQNCTAPPATGINVQPSGGDIILVVLLIVLIIITVIAFVFRNQILSHLHWVKINHVKRKREASHNHVSGEKMKVKSEKGEEEYYYSK